MIRTHLQITQKQKTNSKHSQVFSSKKISPKTKTTSKKLPGFFSEETSFLSHDVFFSAPTHTFQLWFSRCPSPERDGRCKGPHHRRHNLNFCCLKMEERKTHCTGVDYTPHLPKFRCGKTLKMIRAFQVRIFPSFFSFSADFQVKHLKKTSGGLLESREKKTENENHRLKHTLGHGICGFFSS